MRARIVSILILMWSALGDHVEQESANQGERSGLTQTSWLNPRQRDFVAGAAPLEIWATSASSQVENTPHGMFCACILLECVLSICKTDNQPPVALPTSLDDNSMSERHGNKFYRHPESAESSSSKNYYQTAESSRTSASAGGYAAGPSSSPVHTHSKDYGGSPTSLTASNSRYGDSASWSSSSYDGYHEQSKPPHKSRDDDHWPGHGHGHGTGHDHGHGHGNGHGSGHGGGRPHWGRPHDGHHGNRPWHTTKGPPWSVTTIP